MPSELHPLAGTDFYQVLETSDMPAGVINIVTGVRAELAEVLAAHMDVDGLWHFGPQSERTAVERASCSNLKQLWSGGAHNSNLWQCDAQDFLRHATQIKNIWVPYGA